MHPQQRLTVHEWACIRTELYWAYDAKVPADSIHKVIAVKEPGFRVLYLREGTLQWRSPAHSFTVSKGMWLMPPLENWVQEFSEDAEIISLFFACQWPSGVNILDHQGLLIPGSDAPELEQYGSALARMVAEIATIRDKRHYAREFSTYGEFLDSQVLFFQWLKCWLDTMLAHGATLTPQRQTGDERPLKAARCLNEASLRDGFPHQQLAAETGLSEIQINRLFIHEFGLTLRKYWEGRRLQEAKALLETNSTPIKEISYLLGFLSDSHFVTWFRRLTGKKPGEYRNEVIQFGFMVPGSSPEAETAKD